MNGPLDGLRVLDLSRVLAGPYCTMILGDLGADVVKVERPGVGDDLHGWGPPFTDDGESTYFLAVNMNKRSVVVDIQTEAGRDVVRRLAAESDVLIENFRVGLLDSLGLGYDDLKPLNEGLVYCRISGFGQSGPLARSPGYDVVVQAFSGLMSVTGPVDGDPSRVGVAIVDICTGLNAAIAVLAALRAREQTGQGQAVDVSLLGTALAALPNLTAGYLVADAVPQRLGNGHPNATPYGVFATADGHVIIAVGQDAQWRRLCGALDHPEVADDPRFTANGARVAARLEVDALVSEWCRRRTTADLLAALTEHDVPHGPVHTVPEALDHPQVEALGLVQEVADANGSSVRLVRAPITLSDDRRELAGPAPRLGADTRQVLRDIGFGDDELVALSANGAFGPSGVDGDA